MTSQACSGDKEPTPAEGTFLAWVGRLVQRHRARLVHVARREGVQGEDAFDVVQEAFHTFLGLPQARDLVDAPEDCERLLTTVVRNAARNRRRRHHVARPHTSDELVLEALEHEAPSSEELIRQSEEYVKLRGCVASLVRMQRRVVTLRMLEDRPGEDVAEILGVTRNHVAVMLHRAKAELRACMTAGEPRE
ncbi:MAG: sigma-70 family RNA polymerase sigma factor [Myxococcota bacterium]